MDLIRTRRGPTLMAISTGRSAFIPAEQANTSESNDQGGSNHWTHSAHPVLELRAAFHPSHSGHSGNRQPAHSNHRTTSTKIILTTLAVQRPMHSIKSPDPSTSLRPPTHLIQETTRPRFKTHTEDTKASHFVSRITWSTH